MSLENIVRKILNEATKAEQEIRARAEKEVSHLRAKSEREVEEIGLLARKRSEADAREVVRRRVSSARLEKRKRILGAKKMIYDEVFAEAKSRILNLKNEEYLRLLKGFLLAHSITGDEMVMLSKNDRERFRDALPGWVGEVNAELKSRGLEGAIRVSDETRDIAAGLVLSRGRTEVNLSVDVILEELKYSLEGELTRMLFGE